MPDLNVVNLECRSKRPGETFDSDEREIIGFAVENLTDYKAENVTATIQLVNPDLRFDARQAPGLRGEGAYIVPDDRSFGSIDPGGTSKWREFSVWTSSNAPGGSYDVKVEFDYTLAQPDPAKRDSAEFLFFTLDGSGGKTKQDDE